MQDCTTCANYRPRADQPADARAERYMAYIEDSLAGLTMSEKIFDLKVALAYLFRHLERSEQDGILSEEARDQDLRNQHRARDPIKHPF